MRKKRTNWTEQKIAVLIQLYPIETTPRTAEVLGMCERAVKEKARSLGLKKAVKSRWMSMQIMYAIILLTGLMLR